MFFCLKDRPNEFSQSENELTPEQFSVGASPDHQHWGSVWGHVPSHREMTERSLHFLHRCLMSEDKTF